MDRPRGADVVTRGKDRCGCAMLRLPAPQELQTLANRRTDISLRISAVALRRSGSDSAHADAARALAERGAEGAEALLDGLAESDPRLREAAADGLAQVNWRAIDEWIRADASAWLKAGLRDADPLVRGAAARALGRVGGDGAVEALTSAATDPVEDVRLAVASALGRLAPNTEREWEYEPGTVGAVPDEPAVEVSAPPRPALRVSEAGSAAESASTPPEAPRPMIECPGCRRLAKPDAIRCLRCGSRLRP